MFLLRFDCTHGVGSFPSDADLGHGFCVGPEDGAYEGFGGVGGVLFPGPVVSRCTWAKGFHTGERKGRGFFCEPACVKCEIKILLVGHDGGCFEDCSIFLKYGIAKVKVQMNWGAGREQAAIYTLVSETDE